MMNRPPYETAPIEAWPRMKEIRRQNVRHMWSAREQGELVVKGLGEVGLHALLAGFGDPGHSSLGPYYNRLMQNPPELIKCLEAAEAAGFLREICASMRLHIGQLLTGMATWDMVGKRRVVPDFVLEMNWCRSSAKTGQVYAEHLGVPLVIVDLPCKDSPHARDYLVEQMQEAISQIEGVTGRRFDDQAFLRGVANEWRCCSLFARICELNKSVPAPLDYKWLGTLNMPIAVARHRDETVAYVEALYGEVQDRVKRGISTRGWEKKRLLHEGIPPFFWWDFLKLPAQYGAVYVGGEVCFAGFGAWEMAADGSWRAAATPQERGWQLKSREDGLKALTELYLARDPHHHYCLPATKPAEYMKRAQDWKADGVVIHVDKGCRSYQAGVIEAGLTLQEAGIPTVIYEGSQADPRDLSAPQVWDRIESFLENLGLTRLPVETGGDEEERPS